MKASRTMNNSVLPLDDDERSTLALLQQKVEEALTKGRSMKRKSAANNGVSVNFVLTDEPDRIDKISTSLNRILMEDLLSRLPALPRETQLSLGEMFSAELWNSLTMEQRRIVATDIHLMAMDFVYLMPTGKGLDTAFSVHDCSSPNAAMASKAAMVWLRDDELHMRRRKQSMAKLVKARRKIGYSPELDLVIKVMAIYDQPDASQI